MLVIAVLCIDCWFRPSTTRYKTVCANDAYINGRFASIALLRIPQILPQNRLLRGELEPGYGGERAPGSAIDRGLGNTAGVKCVYIGGGIGSVTLLRVL